MTADKSRWVVIIFFPKTAMYIICLYIYTTWPKPYIFFVFIVMIQDNGMLLDSWFNGKQWNRYILVMIARFAQATAVSQHSFPSSVALLFHRELVLMMGDSDHQCNVFSSTIRFFTRNGCHMLPDSLFHNMSQMNSKNSHRGICLCHQGRQNCGDGRTWCHSEIPKSRGSFCWPGSVLLCLQSPTSVLELWLVFGVHKCVLTGSVLLSVLLRTLDWFSVHRWTLLTLNGRQ